MKWLLGILGLIAALMVYVRLAPTDPQVWHVDLADLGEDERVSPGGIEVVVPADDPAAKLAALDSIIRSTPRTRLLAGSVSDGHVTYVTRSLIWGFPDFTTVQIREAGLAIHGRLRFGAADLGVNAARVRGWLAELG